VIVDVEVEPLNDGKYIVVPAPLPFWGLIFPAALLDTDPV